MLAGPLLTLTHSPSDVVYIMHAVSSEMRPRSVGFGGRFVGRRFVAKGVSFFGFTLKRPLVVHIDEPRPRLASSTSPFRTAAPRSGFGCEFCGCFTLQYGILQHMAVHRAVLGASRIIYLYTRRMRLLIMR